MAATRRKKADDGSPSPGIVAPANAVSKDSKSSKSGGEITRRGFSPTSAQRALVESLAGYGIPEVEIAAVVGIARSTLRRHFEGELDTGRTRAHSRVAESLFRQAVGAEAVYDEQGNLLRAELRPNPACAIFWAKTRMGWKETAIDEPEGQPAPTHEEALAALE